MSTSLAAPIFKTATIHPTLHAGEVHLWLARLDASAGTDENVLTADEWLRAERFHHAIDRQHYIASRAALRSILAPYVPAPAGSLRFIRNEFGKPSLAGSLLRFNLSHSDGLMLLAVTHGRELGVDLEAVRENLSFEMLSDHYFAPEDQWLLRTTPEPQRRSKFFELWTRTEAQLKARGIGLSGGLSRDDDGRFKLQSFEPAPRFSAALAVEGEHFELSCWQWMT